MTSICITTIEVLLFDLLNGEYNGYTPLRLRKVRPTVQDNTDTYNIPEIILIRYGNYKRERMTSGGAYNP